jgi:sulfite exporter TauE/SafE
MLASINPLVERGRSSRYWISATAYVVGSVLGGLVIGLVAGAVGAATRGIIAFGPGARLVLVGVAGAIACAMELSRRRVPSIRRQVDERWLDDYRGWVYGLGFGFQLGLGFVTIVTTASLYAVFAAAVLAQSVVVGVVVGLVFGIARAMPLLTMARVRRPEQLRARLRGFTDAAPRARTLTVVASAGLAVVALGALGVGA